MRVELPKSSAIVGNDSIPCMALRPAFPGMTVEEIHESEQSVDLSQIFVVEINVANFLDRQ